MGPVGETQWGQSGGDSVGPEWGRLNEARVGETQWGQSGRPNGVRVGDSMGLEWETQ